MPWAEATGGVRAGEGWVRTRGVQACGRCPRGGGRGTAGDASLRLGREVWAGDTDLAAPIKVSYDKTREMQHGMRTPACSLALPARVRKGIAAGVTVALACTNGYTTRGHHANALCPPPLFASVLCQRCGLRGM